MKDALKSLARSRKAMAAVAGILVTLTLLATGQIEADAATASISGLIGVLVASIAYEDGAEKRAGGTPGMKDSN